jgi:hypothetical protein
VVMRKYVLNPETLVYEIKEVSLKHKLLKSFLLFAGSVGLAFLYAWLFTSVLGFDLPKTALLKAENAKWNGKMDIMNTHMDKYEEALDAFRVRDDDVYRSIFGMDEIPADVRNAGIGGVDRYAYLDGLQNDNLLKSTAIRLDHVARMAYVQDKSFDEVAAVAKTAGTMADCIPTISPVVPDPSKYRITSPYGYRSDPINGTTKMHKGVDFAMKVGNPVYATGDGVVEKVEFDFFGYGNMVTINHGFGYETKYAHLNTITVTEGLKVKRGDCIGEVGRSGRTTGSHLHYEVLYKGARVNPYNYYDMSVPVDEYLTMVHKREGESQSAYVRKNFSLRLRK